MKNTKKIAVIMAIFGTSIGLNAQTYNKSESEKTNQTTGITETTYQKTPVQEDKKGIVVPEAVKTAFSNDYDTRDISPTWKKEGENYKVSFTNESLSSIAVYNKNGKLIEAERELRNNEYPSEINKYCTKNNKNVSVWESNRNGEIKYFTKDKTGGQISWFDKDGNHITGTEHVAHHSSSNRTGYK